MKNNPINSGNPATLNLGEAVLTRVRAIYGDKAKKTGKKLLMEVAEQVRINVASVFNSEDDRITARKPRYAWRPADINDVVREFNLSPETAAKIKALQISTGKDSSTWVEGKDVVTLNILNPFASSVGKEKGSLRVRIVETTTRPNDQSQPKVNPSLGTPVTSSGALVYTITSIEFGDQTQNHVFLPNDRVENNMSIGAPAVTTTAALS